MGPRRHYRLCVMRPAPISNLRNYLSSYRIIKKRKEKKARERAERREQEREREKLERRERERDRDIGRPDRDRRDTGVGAIAGSSISTTTHSTSYLHSPSNGLSHPLHHPLSMALPPPQAPPPPPSSSTHVVDRSTLRNIRVVQRNLAYVLGLPASLASEETLRRPEYFGQYGKIVKVAVTRPAVPPAASGFPGCSAYVTFAHKEDARACIQALDNFVLPVSEGGNGAGRPIRASFGTTKYCNTFLRHVPCNNPECLFLHEVEDDSEGWTREDAIAWQTRMPGSTPGAQVMVGQGGPSGTGRRVAAPIFPPPRWEEPPGGGGGQAYAMPSTTVTAAGNTRQRPGAARPPANPWNQQQQQHPHQHQQQELERQQPVHSHGSLSSQAPPAKAGLLATSTAPSRGPTAHPPTQPARANSISSHKQQQQQQSLPPYLVSPSPEMAPGREAATNGPGLGNAAITGLPQPPPGIISPPQTPNPGGPSLGVLPFDLAADGSGGLLWSMEGIVQLNGDVGISTDSASELGQEGAEGASPPSLTLFGGEDRLGGIEGMPLPGVREEGGEARKQVRPPGPPGPKVSEKTIQPPLRGGLLSMLWAGGGSSSSGNSQGVLGSGRPFSKAPGLSSSSGESLAEESGSNGGHGALQHPGTHLLFSAFPFAGTGVGEGQKRSGLLGHAGAGSLDRTETGTIGGARTGRGNKDARREAFTATECLVSLLGLDLPDAPSSLSARTRACPSLQQPPVPSSTQAPSSRYSFATEEGGAGGDKAAEGVTGMTRGYVGAGSGEASGSLYPSLRSGVALLQQLLPNCSITYGDGAGTPAHTAGALSSSSGTPSGNSGHVTNSGADKDGRGQGLRPVF